MKKQILFILLLTVHINVYCQAQVAKNFGELVNKSQADKSLMGVFKYKEGIARITEYKDLKTAIGKFIEITWSVKEKEDPDFRAIYHNTMGYMTRSTFNIYKQPYKDFKVSKNRYCMERNCIELVEGLKLPYILYSPPVESDLREIK